MSHFNVDTYNLQTSVLDGVTMDDDAMVVRGLKAFRVGSFKNSRGVRGTWTAEMLQAAVDNFRRLRDDGKLRDIPVRLDHTNSVRDVVGWFEGLSFDGTFLRVDVKFTKPDAYTDYKNGHFRNVSMEIGQYETNDEEKVHPVVAGLAFVDIPAVEGLHQNGVNDMTTHSGTSDATDTSGADATGSEGADTSGTPAGSTDGSGEGNPPAGGQPTQQEDRPAAPEGSHSGGLTGVQTYQINGQAVTDVATVQAHITSLEEFRSTTIRDGRVAFVDQLARDRKITNPQKESFTKMVLGMDAETFKLFEESYANAPVANLFAAQGLTDHPFGSTEHGLDPAEVAKQEIETLEESIANHRRAGTPEETIQGFASWQRLQSLKSANGASA